MKGRCERHLPEESEPNRTENVRPCAIVAPLAAGVPAQFFEMKGYLISVHDEGGADSIVEVLWQDDDHRLAKHVVMKLDRPIRDQAGNRCGKLVALLQPQRFEGICGLVQGKSLEAAHVMGHIWQHSADAAKFSRGLPEQSTVMTS